VIVRKVADFRVFPHEMVHTAAARRGAVILPTVTQVEFHWDEAAAEVHRADGCEVLLWAPAPRFLVTRVSGPATVGALQYYIGRAERAMRLGKLTVFHDWSAMARYEPAARDLLKRWGKARGADFDRVTYLVASKVTAMLISVAALTLGRELRATSDRDAFLADLAADLTSFR
jgi:hypothetical protein